MTEEVIVECAIEAFIKAQSEMGAAIKNAKNPFLKNSYADLNAIQEAVFPVFHANGFAIVQSVGADDFGKYVNTKLIHAESEAEFNSCVYLEYKKGDMQSLGGAITYARRYGLLSLTGIPVADDDGNAAVGTGRMKAKQDIKEKRLTKAQEDMLARAEKLEKFLETANADQLVQFGPEVHSLIADIKEFNEDRSIELKAAYDNREAEVLKS